MKIIEQQTSTPEERKTPGRSYNDHQSSNRFHGGLANKKSPDTTRSKIFFIDANSHFIKLVNIFNKTSVFTENNDKLFQFISRVIF